MMTSDAECIYLSEAARVLYCACVFLWLGHVYAQTKGGC